MNSDCQYFDTGEKLFTDGNSIFINYSYEDSRPHLHSHDFIEISYVAYGSGIHILGDKEYKVYKGDLFLINHHIPHEFRTLNPPSNPKLKIYNCVFKPDFIDVNLNDYKDFTDVINYLSFRSIFSLASDNLDDIKLLGFDNAAIEAIYVKMMDEFTRKDDGYIEMLKIYLKELLIVIFRSSKKSGNNEKSVMSRHSKLIENSMQFLKENYSVNLKLSDLSSQSFLSPTYFCKIFKDYSGITVSEYIQKLRIDEACNKLKSSDHKVIVIAEEVGYKDIKHFNEVFKKVVGMTPREYRKHYRHE